MDLPLSLGQQRRSGPERAGVPVVVLGVAALAAASVGFSTFLFLGPYQSVTSDLKRRSGELRAFQSEAEARAKEINRLRHDMVEVQGASGDIVTAEGRLRYELKRLKADLEQRLGPTGAIVTAGPRRVLVQFPEEAVFDARGPWLSKAGQDALQALAQVVGDRVRRVMIAAPLGSATVPRWVRPQYPMPGDLSAARAGNALRALVKDGVHAEEVLAVVGTLETGNDEAATLGVELEL
jgi:flagellar motor protein MotB